MNQQQQMLTSDELAERWRVTRFTVRRWRMEGNGPPYLKLGAGAKSRVLYLLKDIEDWESSHKQVK
jgi:hypothetical protein